MNHEEAARLLHAYADGELDSATSLELEALLERDPALRVACERIRELSRTVRDQAEDPRAPESLAGRQLASGPALPDAPRQARRKPAWNWLVPAGAFAAAAVLTWVVALGTLRPGADERIAREALASHVRATLAGRLYDVASSDQHTVKPWLSARLDYSPPVSDFSAQGFELRGGRVDYLGGRPVAVLVYQRRQHMIDVFVWPADVRGERTYARDGFNMDRFAANGMEFWIVSDLNGNELSDLSRLLAGAAP